VIKTVECLGKDVPFGAYLEEDLQDKRSNALLLKKGTIVDSRIKSLLNKYQGTIKISIEISDKVKEVLNVGECITDDKAFSINSQIKERTLQGVEYMYANAGTKDSVIAARDTSALLTNAVSQSNSINISLNELKVSDDYTFKHCVDVATMAVLVGNALNLRYDDIQNAAIAGILHDIGKTQIPNEILNKPGKLTDREFNIIKNHPVYGYKMLLKSDDISENARRGILTHHEKVDGTGYPMKVTSEKIPLLGKLLAVVDVYDALVTKRPYRSDMIEPAMAVEMMLGMGNQFDAEILKGFLRCVVLYPIGSNIILSDKKVYKVIKQNIGYPLRPVVSDVITNKQIDLLNDKSGWLLTIIAGV
jgi:putative nucleotidyltransferase with HDIG domain